MVDKNTVEEPLDDSLKVLQPEEQFVEVDGEQIFVKPYTFGQLLKALKYLSNLSYILSGGTLTELDILRALADHGEDVLGLVSLSTGLPIEYFDTIPSDKGLDLAILTYKVNESFFAQHLAPKLEEMFPPETTEEEATTTPAKMKKAGSTSSKN